ncbi:MAG TPA: methyltransferase domain-containing protein [Vicinamibacterales bacterium]|nr:methyltransferase domain-containing protein [Vicinamibacterales bacterium]
MVLPPIACSVRSCGRPLVRDSGRVVCEAGHAFDVARSGYLSLLQPQDRRSRTPGDTKEAVAARARLLEAGIGRAAIDAIASRAPSSGGVLIAADLGCGSGELLGALAAFRDVCGAGIDLSTAAVERAARRYPALTWVVANADRRLPLLDGSVHLVVSLNGRRNPDECARVLVPDGTLIVGVPAADDLIELRAAVQGEGVARERVEAVVAAHAARFVLVERVTVRERQRLGGEALRDLLQSTYRGARTSATARVEALGVLDVTLSTDVCVFSRGREQAREP